MDPTKPILKYKSADLPHWRQEGATYAVTYRLADSIPREAAAKLLDERRALERELMVDGELSEEAMLRLDELHSEKVEAWLNNCLGSCALRTRQCAEIIDASLRHFDNVRYKIHAFVIMPNHLHTVVQPFDDWPLDSTVRQWKSFTSRAINKLLARSGPFWNADYYDHLIRGPRDFEHAVKYVLANPVVAGLTNWPWVYAAPELQANPSESV